MAAKKSASAAKSLKFKPYKSMRALLLAAKTSKLPRGFKLVRDAEHTVVGRVPGFDGNAIGFTVDGVFDFANAFGKALGIRAEF